MAIQRTAMGKAVDMSILVTQNEKTRAVGNMGVNARGDVLDNQNRVVRDSTSRVKAQYENTVTSKNSVNTGMSFEEIAPDHTPENLTEEEKLMEQEFNDDEDIQK